jgi:diadenosine tetraphosphate (Ap4A) HIT family hydrolase
VLLESDEYLCFLDEYPVTEGHALVVPKEHIQTLDAANSLELYQFVEEAHAVIRRRYDPGATNLGINNGEAAGQTVPHLHWHIIPRYDGDIADPTGGVRGVIPEKRIYTE